MNFLIKKKDKVQIIRTNYVDLVKNVTSRIYTGGSHGLFLKDAA